MITTTTTATFRVERRAQCTKCHHCGKRIEVGRWAVVRNRSGWIADYEIRQVKVFCSGNCEWQDRVVA